MCINLLKMSCRKRWKWHFRDPKFKTFPGGACPQTPLGWGWGCNLKISHVLIYVQNSSYATPLKVYYQGKKRVIGIRSLINSNEQY